jgi:hypothetical protein
MLSACVSTLAHARFKAVLVAHVLMLSELLLASALSYLVLRSSTAAHCKHANAIQSLQSIMQRRAIHVHHVTNQMLFCIAWPPNRRVKFKSMLVISTLIALAAKRREHKSVWKLIYTLKYVISSMITQYCNSL